MKIFVTGANGFIGRNFVKLASTSGYSVTALIRSRTSCEIIGDNTIQCLNKNLSELQEIDFKGHDVLVHLAAHSANHPYDTLENCLYWNVCIPLKILQFAKNAGIKKVIVAGSCFEYGLSANRYEYIPIEATLEPVSSYPISKAAASIAMIGLARQNKLDLTILRLFQVYGPGELESRLWPSLKKAATDGVDFPMTLGNQVRDFIHVQDVAKIILSETVSNKQSEGPKIRNVGTGIPCTLADFANKWWNEWGARGQLRLGMLPYRGDEIMRIVAKID